MYYFLAGYSKPVATLKCQPFLNHYGKPFLFGLRDAIFYASQFNCSYDDLYFCVKPFKF